MNGWGFGKVVTVIEHGTDRYGRTLGDVILPDGESLNQELVRSGLAWWYRKYSKDTTLKRLEVEARAAKRGLWSDAKPAAPWDWADSAEADTAKNDRGLNLTESPLPV